MVLLDVDNLISTLKYISELRHFNRQRFLTPVLINWFDELVILRLPLLITELHFQEFCLKRENY